MSLLPTTMYILLGFAFIVNHFLIKKMEVGDNVPSDLHLIGILSFYSFAG